MEIGWRNNYSSCGEKGQAYFFKRIGELAGRDCFVVFLYCVFLFKSEAGRWVYKIMERATRNRKMKDGDSPDFPQKVERRELRDDEQTGL